MTSHNVTEIRPGAGAQTTDEPPPPTVLQLRETVELLDEYSQQGFGRIEAIARLALAALENPEALHTVEDIARALEELVDIADFSQNSINMEAERVACNYKCPARRRRRAAAKQR